MADVDNISAQSTAFRRKTVELCLRSDAELHREAVAAATHCLRSCADKPDLLSPNERAATAAETLEHWEGRGAENSAALSLVRPLIACGAQPIFAAVSFCVSAGAPTVFLPVPYNLAAKSVEDFKQTLLIAGAENFTEATDEGIEAAARAISHALANISYSVRIDDDPIQGWLALSHVRRQAIYLPDVSDIAATEGAEEQDVRTAAESEEPFLAMASVLYLPICSGAGDQPAPATLMLWSPVPRRWDGIVTPTGGGFIAESESLREQCWQSLKWLNMIAEREFSNLKRTELELISFFLAMAVWADTQGSHIREHYNSFFHGTFDLLKHLPAPTGASMRLQDWIVELVKGVDGLANGLRWAAKERRPDFSIEKLSETPTTLRRWDAVEALETTLGRLAKDETIMRAFFDDTLCIPFGRDTAINIAKEPADNIAKHATRLTHIEISATRRYVTLSLEEEPRVPTSERLVGSPQSFSRYYAVRRGLAQIPTSDAMLGDGLGLGHWLYRVFSDHVGVFSKLHVSPAGGRIRSLVTIRLSEDGSAP